MTTPAPPEELIPGVYFIKREERTWLATRAAVRGNVYGERTIEGYRLWDPNRSKLAALILKSYRRGQPPPVEIDQNMKILYLGAATGTTVSHLSDILRYGLIYAVEFSPRAMHELLILCEARSNIIPILEDAASPSAYSPLVEPVDMIYQDVAQRHQAEIAIRNAHKYLKPGGTLILMIKSRSIDVTRDPEEIYRQEIENLKGMRVAGFFDLEPYHLDHRAVIAHSV